MKKSVSIICVILCILFCVTMSYSTEYEAPGTLSVTDASTDYTTANTVTWKTSFYKDKTVIVRNTSMDALTLRVRLNTYSGGLWYEFQEGTLDGTSDTIIYFEPFFQGIEIAVKDASGDTASCTINWGGNI